jgi:hypothetical protein
MTDVFIQPPFVRSQTTLTARPPNQSQARSWLQN